MGCPPDAAGPGGGVAVGEDVGAGDGPVVSRSTTTRNGPYCEKTLYRGAPTSSITTRVTPGDGYPNRTVFINGLCTSLICSARAIAVVVFGKSKNTRSGFVTRSP